MKKTRLIPIEVLRVEDKICGSLNFLQLGLLAAPLGAAAFLLILPPAGSLTAYKLVLVVLIFIPSGLLAVRLNGRLVLAWLLLAIRYRSRPKLYLKPPAAPEREPSRPPALDVQKFVPAQAARPPLVPIKPVSFKPQARSKGGGRG